MQSSWLDSSVYRCSASTNEEIKIIRGWTNWTRSLHNSICQNLYVIFKLRILSSYKHVFSFKDLFISFLLSILPLLDQHSVCIAFMLFHAPMKCHSIEALQPRWWLFLIRWWLSLLLLFFLYSYGQWLMVITRVGVRSVDLYSNCIK